MQGWLEPWTVEPGIRVQHDISYPVNNGIVQNWDDMCHVWDHAFFNELKVTFWCLVLNVLLSIVASSVGKMVVF